jgi:hypothetical protein
VTHDELVEGDAQAGALPADVANEADEALVELTHDADATLTGRAEGDAAESEAGDRDVDDASGSSRAEVPTQGALPLGVRTGDARVDAAMQQLADLESLPVADHAQVFTEVHRALQDALVDLDRP